MDILAQCGTTAGGGKYRIQGGKREVCGTSFVTVVTLEKAMVEGVSEGKGKSVPCDICAATGAVGVVPGRGSEPIRIRGSEGVIEEELHARAEEAA